jgi:hypothetical protein
MSIYAALSTWAYRRKQSLEAEQAIVDYLLWLHQAGRPVFTEEDFVNVPREATETFMATHPSAVIAVTKFSDFITKAHKCGGGNRPAKVIQHERARLISILRAQGQRRRRDLVGMLHWRRVHLDATDAEMRKIWGFD